LGKKDKAKRGAWIEDEDGESMTFAEILELKLIEA
jgi:hypothetical protein